MEAYTLAISIIVSVLVLWLSPVYGIILYMATLAWYPPYLTVKLGTIDFTAYKIVIIAVWLKLLLDTKLLGQFRVIWLDKLVVFFFLCQILAGSFTTPFMSLLENRGGSFFESVLPYFAVRIAITNKEKYLFLLKGILVVAAPLAVVGLFECMTGHNPFGFLQQYHAWREDTSYKAISRYGFYRAEATFSMSIMFGLFFAVLGPVCAGLYYNVKKHKFLILTGIGLMAGGVFSSVSSGPALTALLAILFIAFYPYRRHWRLALIFVVLMCGLVEFISNRHFYDVLGGFTLNPHTAWYRSKLISVALFEGGMSGHWLFGYGLFDPQWGSMLDGRSHTDMVNHYLKVLCCYGLVGLLPFLGIIALLFKRMVRAYKLSKLNSDRWLVWCLGASFVGLLPAMVSVSLFGQPHTVFYIILGFCGSMPFIIQRENLRLLNSGVFSQAAL